MSLVLSYPAWFIVLCILGGLIYAGALYMRDRLNKHFSKALIALLAFFRFAVVAIIAFFLLGPLLKQVSREEQKPIIVIAQDNSESLVMGKDSLTLREELPQALQQLTGKLEEQYEVQTYTFGDQLNQGLDGLNFDEQYSNFSDLFDQLYARYSNRNLGAVVVGSDGLYNVGQNPLYAYGNLKAPIYTVALGDTTPSRDLLINRVLNNRLAYLGNKFPIEISVQARKLQGQASTLRVTQAGKVLHSEKLNFTSEDQIITVPLTFEAKKAGLQRYRISLNAVEGEQLLSNNARDVFIDVLDSRQKVLILAQNPHPDVAALEKSISANDNYSCDVERAKDFKGDVKDYSLVIFHQLPAANRSLNALVEAASAAKVPQWYILGTETNYDFFNRLGLGFSFNKQGNTTTEGQAAMAEGFSAFKLEAETKTLFRQLPPLTLPFGKFEASAGASTMLQEQVGNISTSNPILAFNASGESKIGVLRGEGIWRWRLASFAQTDSHETFNEWTSRVVQYLANKDDKRLFRTQGERNFLENENVIVQAELYNASYQPVTDADISMVITNEAGEEFPFGFSAAGTGESYQANAGKLPVGNYNYSAKTTSDGQILRSSGAFSVSAVQLEQSNTTANHALLSKLAEKSGGRMLYLNELPSLANELSSREDIVNVSYEQKELTDLIDKRWILFILLALLSVEWLLRKRNGAY